MTGHIVGIEGTAHTAGVGIVGPDGRILSNIIDSYSPEEGGIHPREAADHHSDILPDMIDRAMKEADLDRTDLAAVAFSQGPGLGPCLRTAATAARALSVSMDIPLIGVNHCVAHLEVGDLTGATDPILLYVSGGNTQVIAFVNGRYRVFGETMDIGIGNMLDKFGSTLGIPFPAAPVLEAKARNGGELLPLPYSVKGMDVAFSGILTSAARLHEKGASIEDLSHSIQETAFAMLVEVTERALAHTGKEEVLLGGGVAQNARLVEMVDIMCRERGASHFVPPPPLLRDNGAMIAYTGLKMFNAGAFISIEESGILQRFRTEEVEVTWR